MYEFKDEILIPNNLEAMKKVGSEVYSLPVFKKDFTKFFLEELQHFKSGHVLKELFLQSSFLQLHPI